MLYGSKKAKHLGHKQIFIQFKHKKVLLYCFIEREIFVNFVLEYS